MNKNIIGIVAVAVMVTGALFATTVGAEDNANMFQKVEGTWERTGDGNGVLTLTDDSFTFEGQGLIPEEDYSLIVYDTGIDDEDSQPNGYSREGSVVEWPGQGPVLATDTASEEGTLSLEGEITCLDEAKIWLVPTSDVNEGGIMTAWNSDNYLFEDVRFNTCLEDEPTPSPTPEVENEPSVGNDPQTTDCSNLDALTEEQAQGDCGVSKVKEEVTNVGTFTIEPVVEAPVVQEELVAFPSTGYSWF